MRSALYIANPTLTRISPEKWRVSSKVGRRDIWFESSAELTASPEAFLCAFLFPAMARGAGVRMPASLCPTFLKNVETAKRLGSQWWGYSGGAIDADGTRYATAREGTAAFFSGGVDSFFTLLEKNDEIEFLIFVEGYDIPLSDTPRLAAACHWMQEIADAMGKKLLVVRSNLREHPEFRLISWGYTFGSALAAAGHLLAGYCNRLYIPSSEPYWRLYPWGSHPELDPSWGSSATEFEVHGADHERIDKVRKISVNPLVHRYLRVCWERKNERMNCGICEKCVRTQLELSAAGAPHRVQTFPEGDLVGRINGLPGVPAHVVYYYQLASERIADPSIARAIEGLLERSQRWRRRQSMKKVPVELWRRLRRVVG